MWTEFRLRLGPTQQYKYILYEDNKKFTHNSSII